MKSFAKSLQSDQDKAVEIFEQTHRYYFPEEHTEDNDPISPLQKKEDIEGLQKIIFAGIGIAILIGFGIFISLKEDQVTDPTIPSTVEQDVSEDVPASITPDTPLREPEPTTTETQAGEVDGVVDIVEDEAPDQSEAEAVQRVQRELEREREAETSPADDTEAEQEINIRPFPLAPLYTIADVDHQQLVNEYIPAASQNISPDKQNVFIRATNGDSWITYKEDDGPIRRIILQEGRYTTLEGDVIRIFIGNLNALRIFLNNQLIDAPSRTGVKSIVFPDERKSDFSLPLFIYPESGGTITSEQYLEQRANREAN